MSTLTSISGRPELVNAIAELAKSPRIRDHVQTRSALADKLLEATLGSAFAEKISSPLAPSGCGFCYLQLKC
jgi:hypothetical protein